MSLPVHVCLFFCFVLGFFWVGGGGGVTKAGTFGLLETLIAPSCVQV